MFDYIIEYFEIFSIVILCYLYIYFEFFFYKEVIFEYWVKKGGGFNCVSKEREVICIILIRNWSDKLLFVVGVE